MANKDRRAATASALMVRDIPRIAPGGTVAAARAGLRGGKRGAAGGARRAYVTDAEGALVGAVTLADLLMAEDATPLATLTLPVAGVDPDLDQELVAAFAADNGLSEVAVVGPDGRLAGVVLARDLIRVLEDEHREDLNRFTGVMHREADARRALEIAPWARVRDRLPWLLVGLTGCALAAAVMAGAEAALARTVSLAFFVPAIVYLADAIGTQTEAVAVRGLSLTRRSIGRILAQELLTGLIIGAVLGALAVPAIGFVLGDWHLALAVGISVVAAGGAATSIGVLLPWGFGRLGLDPALGSGPIATVIQDILSLLVYFWIAEALLGA